MPSPPFRPCDYCGRRTAVPHQPWTVLDGTRKISCPDCADHARKEDRAARRVIKRYGHLLEHRLVSEPATPVVTVIPPQTPPRHVPEITADHWHHLHAERPNVLWVVQADDDHFHAYGTDAQELYLRHGLAMTTTRHMPEPFARRVSIPRTHIARVVQGVVRTGKYVAVYLPHTFELRW